MISKTLFGTMNVDDVHIVNEQLKLLRNNQNIIQDAVKNQLKILNVTINYTDHLEKTLTYNKNLLSNGTQRMGAQLAKFAQQEDIIEHLLIITTIMFDLIQEGYQKLYRLPDKYCKYGLILTRLLQLEKIIKDLRSITKGLSVQNTNRELTNNSKIYDDKYIMTDRQFTQR